MTVEVVHGGLDDDDQLVDPTVTDLALADSYDGGRWRYDGDDPARPRPARSATPSAIVPRHSVLASVSEMGLVALP